MLDAGCLGISKCDSIVRAGLEGKKGRKSAFERVGERAVYDCDYEDDIMEPEQWILRRRWHLAAAS